MKEDEDELIAGEDEGRTTGAGGTTGGESGGSTTGAGGATGRDFEEKYGEGASLTNKAESDADGR
ncbi:MAG TPA: hypothetical protein VF735_07535 [Pyrinomonadaceae bacterium]|jgi:hypothetical protein